MSQPYIVGAMVVAVADTALTSLIDNKANRAPAMRVLVGGWAVTVGLLLIAEKHDAFASAAATVILLATMTGPNNDGLIKAIGNAVGSKPTAVSSPTFGDAGNGIVVGYK